MKYTFYDTETTGLLKRYDYALTFSAKTYDQDFNLIDEINLQTGLRPGLIPSVFAIATNKLKISDLKNSNMSFFEMTRQIYKYFEKHIPGYIVGHNSIGYDEEILRSHFYQCLLPVYPTQTLGNQRADTLIMARAAASFCPDILKVSYNDKNKLDFKLESLSKVNHFDHSEAHTAESDVIACAAIFKKIKDNNLNFFNQCLSTTSKKGVDSFFQKNLVFCYAPSVDQKLILSNCLKIDSSYVTFDLNEDPENYFDYSAKDLSKIIRKKGSPFHFIKNNRQPILLDLSYKKFTNNFLTEKDLLIRARKIRDNSNFCKAIKIAATLTEKEWPAGTTVEEKIFSGGFPETFDRNLMKKFHESNWNERVEIASQFEDQRFSELAIRIIYEENITLLDKKDIEQVEKTINDRIYSSDNKPRSLHQAISEFENYKEKNPGVDTTPLKQYEEYLTAL